MSARNTRLAKARRRHERHVHAIIAAEDRSLEYPNRQNRAQRRGNLTAGKHERRMA